MQKLKSRLLSWLYCPSDRLLTILPRKNIKCGDHYIYYRGSPEVRVLVMASYNPSQVDPPVFQRRNYNSGKSSAESPRGINAYRLGCYVAENIAQEKDCDLVFLDGLNCPQHVEKFIRENPELQRGERAVIEYSYKGLLYLNFGGCKNSVFRGIIKKDKHYIEIEQPSNADYAAQKLNCAGVQLSCGYYNEGSGVETVDEFSLNHIIADGFSYIRAIAEQKELKYIE